jgi:Phage integrase family
MTELIEHVNKHQLKAEDKLLFGLGGLPLGDKALNRITNRLSSVLQLSGDEKITPHGFRATISTLLSERGIDLNSIRFLLGHSEKDNLHFYIRRYGRHIQVLRRELTRLEEELSQKGDEVIIWKPDFKESSNKERETDTSQSPIIPKETLIQLLQTHPDVAAMILQKGLVQL